MLNKTKVIATIGPSTMEKSQLKKLIENGTDVVRLNMSHSNYNFCKDILEKVSEINKELGFYVATMIDLVGPEVRTGHFINGQAYFREGDKVKIHMDDVLGDSSKFSVNYPDLIKVVTYNSIILINEGFMRFSVIDIKPDCLVCEALNDGVLDDCRKLLSKA